MKRPIRHQERALRNEAGRVVLGKRSTLALAVLLFVLLAAVAVAAATRSDGNSADKKAARKTRTSAPQVQKHQIRPDDYDRSIAALHGPKFFPTKQPQDAYVVWVEDGGNGREVLSVQYRTLHVDVCEQSQSPCQAKNRVLKRFHAVGADLSLEYGPLGQNPTVTGVRLPKETRAWWTSARIQVERPDWLKMRFYPGAPGNRPNAKAVPADG
jgi:hypothetical protein